jgi:tetratricopeptide (TPR) repeat protein
MGRWSIRIGAFALVSITGCSLPFASNLGQQPEQLTATPGQNLVPSVSSGKTAADPDLPADKAAKLCFATGVELEKNGHFDQAIHQYELSLEKHPNQPVVHKKIAGCLCQQRKYEQAIAQYQKGLVLAPRDADLLNDLGYTYYEKGEYETAEKYLRQALAAKSDYQRAYGNLGLALGRQQKWKDSLDAFKKAGPPATAQAHLASMYLAAGMHDEARKCCNIALGLDANLQLAKDLLAKLDNIPKDDKTVQQAEARLSKNESGSSPLAAGEIKLQRPVKAKPAEPLEFKPVSR